VPNSSSKRIRIGIFAGLCWLYACIQLDRQILGILAESVKSDLRLDDAALGALTGSAFSIVYALLGLYFGRLADTANRLTLVRIGACIWSLASISAAFAPGYSLLVASRAGVAVGEAIAASAAVSLMAEVAGVNFRARAASVFAGFAFLGAGLSAILGGAVIHYFRDSLVIVGWRAALVSAGLPGFVGALYLSFYRWRDSTAPTSARVPRDTLLTLVLVGAALVAVIVQMHWRADIGVPVAVIIAGGTAAFWTQRLFRRDPIAFQATVGRPAFRWFLLGFAAVLFVDFAAGFWLIPFAQRRFGVSAASAGSQLGGLIIVGGIAGTLIGGWVADSWRRLTPSGRVWAALAAVVLEVIAILVALAQTDYQSFLVAFGIFCVGSGGWTGVAPAIGLDIVPRAHHGTAVASYYLVTTLLGPGLGVWAAGAAGDALNSLAKALSACCLLSLVAFLAFIKLARSGGLEARDDP
jgi:MFS family permease